MDEMRMNGQYADLSDVGGGVKGGYNAKEVKENGKLAIISILAILVFVEAIVYFCVI